MAERRLYNHRLCFLQKPEEKALLFSRGSDSTLGVDGPDPEPEAGSSLGWLPRAPHRVRIAR